MSIILCRNNDSMELAPRDRHLAYPPQRAEDADRLTVVSISRAVLHFLGVSYRSSECNEFISTLPLPPFPPCPVRGAHIYAYGYICMSLPSAFVTFSFSHKASIRVHLRAKTPPSVPLASCAYLSHFSLFSVSFFLQSRARPRVSQKE